jgi:hypothetical protein
MRLLRRGAGWANASIRGGVYTLGLVACAGQATSGDELSSVHGDLTAAETNEAALGGEATCDALLGRLQSTLLAQVNERAAQARQAETVYYGGGVFIDDVVPEFSGVLPAPAPAPAAPTNLEVAAPSGLSSPVPPASAVDEGDFVKADGDRIYLLHGNVLYVLNAWPANATLVLSTVTLEGEPVGLHVQDGTVAVTSRLYGPLPGTAAIDSPYYYYYPSFTKLTVLDTTGEAPEVLRESYVEGDSYSSRRTGSSVHAVVQQSSKAQLDYPNVSYADIFGHPRSQVEIDVQVDLWALLASESIEDSRIEDYLPAAYERVAGELVQQPLRCADYLLPAGSLTQAGSTSVVSLDLDAPAAPLETLSLLGYADSVYIDEDAVVLWQTDYGDYTSPLPTANTNVHLFALDGTSTTYTASGRVEGYIAQAGLDEVGGIVRVVTIRDSYETLGDAGVESVTYVGTSTRLLTLEANQGALSELGRTPEFPPTQSSSAARLAGDRAYILTSGTENLLQVVDLSDPAAPVIRGNVPTRGYASVLIPLANDLVFSIGDNYDPLTSAQNLTLQLFDVSDASEPALAHEFAYPANTYSDASSDARTISFHPTESAFALPVQNNGATSLDVFRFSSAAGFERLGGIAPEPIEFGLLECLGIMGYPTDPEYIEVIEQDPSFVASLLEQCDLYYQPVARRGLFRAGYVYAVSTRSVSAHALASLGGPALSQVDLPAATYSSTPGIPVPVLPPPVIIEGSAGAGGGSFE